MKLEWIHERPARWDADKARIVAGAPAGIFDFGEKREGQLLPGEWWRVERGDRCVGFGWMDLVWGDAEILLAVDPMARQHGVGTFILDRLEEEARARGLGRLYNIVRPTHPDREAVTRYLVKRGFVPSEGGLLARKVVMEAG